MELMRRLLAVVKLPAATSSPEGRTAREKTGPPLPAPMESHTDPLQRARGVEAKLPLLVNVPPAMTSPLGMTARAETAAPRPVPMACQALVVLFQRATEL